MPNGAEVHEFYLVQPGSLRPQRYGYQLVGELTDEQEMHDFISYAEGSFTGRLRTSQVRYSWANWKRYERPKRARGASGRNRS